MTSLEHSQFSLNFDFSSTSFGRKRQAEDDDNFREGDWEEDHLEDSNDGIVEDTSYGSAIETDSNKRPRLEDDDDHDWNEMFDILIHYGIQHSHCNVPFNYTIDESDGCMAISLGAWLAQQLDHQRSNVLQTDRLQKLQVKFPHVCTMEQLSPAVVII